MVWLLVQAGADINVCLTTGTWTQDPEAADLRNRFPAIAQAFTNDDAKKKPAAEIRQILMGETHFSKTFSSPGPQDVACVALLFFADMHTVLLLLQCLLVHLHDRQDGISYSRIAVLSPAPVCACML